MMKNPDYSPQFYGLPVTTGAMPASTHENSDDFHTLVRAAQLAQGTSDESAFFRWLARFGIKKSFDHNNNDEVAAPVKFSELRKKEFNRASFNYGAYMRALLRK